MVLKSSLPDVPIEKLNLSFSGCGFLGIYHMGVACCFREYLPQICERQISGASAGALVATALACNLNLGKCACHILEVAIKARHRALGPFHPNFNINEIMLNALNEVLPSNAHELVNGRVNISVTRVSDGQNCILSHFETRAELIQAILCSCFIPFWSGYIPPKFQGVAYMDGGFSKNLLILDENTITVSPFSGESDICPLDSTYNAYKINFSNTSISLSLENLYRLTRILFPPEPEIMGQMCAQGFHDALRYLQRNNRISCTRCIAVNSSYIMDDENECKEPNEQNLSDDDDDYLYKNSKELKELNDNLKSLSSSFNNLNNLVDLDFSKYEDQNRNELSDDEIDEELRKLVEFNLRMNSKRKDETLKEEFIQAIEQDFKHGRHQDNCKHCQTRKENIYKDNLPENVNQAIQEACDKVNKGLINYIFKFRIVKIMSTLSLPYVLPFDIMIALLRKLRKLLPIVTTELSTSLKRIILFAINLVNNVKDKELNVAHLANFNYKVALTEFNYNDQTTNLTKDRQRKISTSSNYSVDSIYDQTDKPKMQKSNSFKMRRTNSIEDIRFKLKKICSNENLSQNNFNSTSHLNNQTTNNSNNNNQQSNYSTLINQDPKKMKRKSFAGNESNLNINNNNNTRRVSMLEFINCKQPERVLSKMNYNFSIDLNDINAENSDLNHNKVYHNNMNYQQQREDDSNYSTIQSAQSSRPETPAPINLINNALNLGINDIEQREQSLDKLNLKLKELTKSRDALLALHYKDDDNNVQVMEIYNVENSDSSNDEDNQTDEEISLNQYDQSSFDKRERKKNILFRS